MNGDRGGDAIRSERRGFHWVAWRAAPGTEGPADGLLMVGQTQEEAEARLSARLAAS
jgi:hypothetical protein